jgi:hypothetical protein
MKAEALRFLLVSFGFALSVGVAGQGALAPSAEAAISAQTAVPQSVVADEGAGPDDPDEDEGESEGGDDQD